MLRLMYCEMVIFPIQLMASHDSGFCLSPHRVSIHWYPVGPDNISFDTSRKLEACAAMQRSQAVT